MFVTQLMNRLLIDTNILVYAKDVSSVFHQLSTTLLKSDNQLFTTSKNLTEYYAVVTKGENPLLHPTEALQDLIDFSSICTILFPTEASTQLLSQFVSKHLPKGLKIHDFEIAAIALSSGVNRIATINKSDFLKIDNLEIIAL